MPEGFFIKLTADDGTSGWGEVASGVPSVIEALLHDVFAGAVVGSDPFSILPTIEKLFYESHDSGPGGVLANAIAGVDIALWDLKGRLLKRPISDLLGGAYRDRIDVYGSFATRRWTEMSPRDAADQAMKFAKLGFRAAKCRMQIRESHLNPSEDRTLEYVDAIHRRVGRNLEFFVDINNGYSAKRAIQIGRTLRDRYQMNYLEEPCSDQNHAETKQVVDALDLAIIAGEKEYTPFQFEELIRYADPDFLNPDVGKAMGISGLQKIGVLSQVNQKPIILHNTRPAIATAAALQIAATLPIIGPFMEYVDFTADRQKSRLMTVRNPPRFENGALVVPREPGLGIEIDEDQVRSKAQSIRVAGET